MPTSIKIVIGVIALAIAIIMGAFLYEKIPDIFSFLGLSAMRNLTDIRADLERENQSLRERESTHNKIIADYQAELDAGRTDNRKLTEKLIGLEEQQRREREILARFDQLIDSATGPIGTAFSALDEVDRATTAIERIIREFDQPAEGISEESRGANPIVENHSDR